MGVAYNSSIVTSGLVLALDAANTKSYPGSGTTWTDLSGNSNTGTLTNGPTYSSANGGSIVFDGSDDKIVTPMNSSFVYGTSPFAIDAWIYVTGYTGQYSTGTIWSQTISGRNYFYMYVYSPGGVSFRFGDGGGTEISTSTSMVQLNTWMHVCFTRVGTGSNQFFIYVNGVQQAVSTVSYDFNETTYIPTIGQYTHSDQLPFLGRISNLKVYKGKGLTATEVSQNYNALKSRYI
jgi:hypothetical protein